MKTIKPNTLKKNDTFRIITPSTSMDVFDKIDIQKSEQTLIDNEYRITYGKNVYTQNILRSSSVQERLADIEDALNDNKVQIILPYTGGYNVNQLLPCLDFEQIKKSKKIWCGYSDITVLLNAIYAKTGLITYLGPNASTLGKKYGQQYTYNSFFDQLTTINETMYQPSSYWYDDNMRQKNDGPFIINPGKAQSTSIGGNLCSLNLLQGTEYMPSLDNSILFIEDDPLLEDFDVEFERNLYSLLQQPDGMKIKGICIGRFQTACNMTREKLDAIFDANPFFKTIPIIANMDFGHTLPMITIPIGGTCTIDATGNIPKISWRK